LFINDYVRNAGAKLTLFLGSAMLLARILCCKMVIFNIWLVLKIPRKRSFPFYYLALCCLFAFIWHLSLTLLVA